MRSGVTSDHWFRSSLPARARSRESLPGFVTGSDLEAAALCAAWQRTAISRRFGVSGGQPTAEREMQGFAAAFTLVEMLVVAAIILILMGLAVPAFNALNSAGNVTKAAYDISGTLEQARAYAMANNTYVFIGIAEVDSSVPESKTPQVAATLAIGGRVAIAVVASRDGTRGYDVNDPANSWNASYANGANLTAISKLTRIDNLHLFDFGSQPPTSGQMSRPAIPDPADTNTPNYRLGNGASLSSTPFSWPLGSPNTAGSAQYYFAKVINIDPQGVVRMQGAGNGDSIPQWMELDLQPTHGNVTPPDQNSGNQVALQVDSLTGAVRIYRPWKFPLAATRPSRWWKWRSPWVSRHFVSSAFSVCCPSG